jgi:hypothetical protein
LDWAQRICFLGFGFDPINCGNLRLDSVLDTRVRNHGQLPTIYATTYGLTAHEVGVARVLACGESRTWYPFNGDNVIALRELGVLA